MRFSPLRKACVAVVAATTALGLAACGASNPSDGDSSDAKKSGSSITVTDVTGFFSFLGLAAVLSSLLEAH